MQRGSLRIYVGYASGVGKTFAMLDEARRRKERGADVVVGIVNARGREGIVTSLRDLEVVPPRIAEGPQGPVAELNLEALLARRPEVAIVDELAHANAPGSKHLARYEDVQELLEAGIHVISTVNIQQLESLRDLSERILGVPQTETVPDVVVRGAEQLELVDMTPEALRRRVAHGGVHPPEAVDAALARSFQVDVLAQLRELALLWMVDRVDESLRLASVRHPGAGRERILAGVAGRTQDEPLVRRAARMAARSGGELLVVHVVTGRQQEDPSSRTRIRELVEEVGGAYEEVAGPSVPQALLEVARAERATQIVLGASGSRRRLPIAGSSIVDKVTRGSGSIDVHVISRAAAPPRLSSGAPRRTGLSMRRRTAAAAAGMVALALLTIALNIPQEPLPLSSAMLLYLTVVVAVSVAGGWWPGIGAALMASALLNYFFTEPVHRWTVERPEDVVALVVFVVVAVVVSVLVGREARQRAEAQERRAEAEILAALTTRVATEDDPLPGLVEHLRATFGLEAVSVLRREDEGSWTPEASSGEDPPAGPVPGAIQVPLAPDVLLVFRGGRMPAASLRMLQAFGAQLLLAVRSRVLAREAAEAASLAEIDALRLAILAAVSHDLRTPLASIKASVSSLRDDEVAWSPEDEAEFLATIEEETDRLTNLVENLLDMSRLQTGSYVLVRRPVGLDEVVPKALASLHDGGRRVRVEVPESLPRIDVDPGLLERAIANVVANAEAWNPSNRFVRVQASAAADRVELRVIDRGPGVRPELRPRMFEPFQRLGDRPVTDGVGLGLAVARGFVEAMDGTIEAEDTPGGGLTIVFGFPKAAA